MATGKKRGLLHRALSESAQHRRTFKIGWFAALEKRDPALAKEITELAKQWHDGHEELVAAYPTKQALSRFIASLGLDVKPQSVSRWLDTVQ